MNEASAGHRNDALDRVEAKRQVRLLETRINNWVSPTSAEKDIETGRAGTGSEPVPEQAPPRVTPPHAEIKLATQDNGIHQGGPLSTLTEMSAEFSLEDGSAEFILLQDNLKSRLSRAETNVSTNHTDYFV